MRLATLPLGARFAIVTRYHDGPVRSVWRHDGPSGQEPGVHWATRETPRQGFPARDRFSASCPVQNAPEGVGTAR